MNQPKRLGTPVRISSPRPFLRRIIMPNTRYSSRPKRNYVILSARENPLNPVYSPAYEFQQPEYIQEQKNILLREISELKAEVQPLQRKLHKLSCEEEAANEEKDQSLSLQMELPSPENWISARLAKLHAEFDQLSVDLAKLRRTYTEQTEEKLEYDIEYQRSELAALQEDVKQCEEATEKYETQLKAILTSETTNSIKEQRERMEYLRKHLHKLSTEESKMIDQYMHIVNDVPSMEENKHQVVQRKRKLQLTNHQKVKLSVELRKVSKSYSMRIEELKAEIDRRNQIIAKRNSRDNWRKSFKFVNQEDALMEQLPIPPLPDTTETSFYNVVPPREVQTARSPVRNSQDRIDTNKETISLPATPKAGQRVKFNMDELNGMGKPRRLSDSYNNYPIQSPPPRFVKMAAIDEGEDEDEELDEDEMLDLGNFTPEFRIRERPGDTFFAESMQEISDSLLVPQKE